MSEARPTRLVLAARAAKLRGRGLPYAQVAERLGVSVSYAHELVTDPHGERARRRKARYAGRCGCGRATSGHAGRGGAPARCVRCRDRERHERARTSCAAGLSAFAAEHGRAPSAREFAGASNAQQLFGSWAAALAAAGLKPRRAGRPARSPSAGA